MKCLRKLFAIALGVTAVAAGCDDAQTSPELPTEVSEARAPEARLQARGRANVVEITPIGHTEFRLSTQEVPAGWTTFRMPNASHATHFALVEKYPEGRGIEDFRQVIAPVFQNIMDSLLGKEPSFPEAGFALPAWYSDVVFRGGPGLAAPGEASEVTLHLDPGTYVIECYVKEADGTFHSVLGMVEQLVVTEESSRAKEPRATLGMTLSTEDGIEVDETVRPGKHTVAVHFEDQTVYSNFVGHDVHLVRLDNGTDISEVAAWMDWTAPGGLAEPAPATFIGGLQDMPAGATGYMTVHLKPGRYAWVAEVPDPAEKGMLKTFTVPFGQRTGR